MITDIIIVAVLIIFIVIFLYLNRNKRIAKSRKMYEKYKHDLDGPH